MYLLGRCVDRAEAVRRKFALIARFHFDPAMIRIHPDNGSDKLLYGAKVLGSYVGSEESIANRLEKKLAELKKEADAITMVGRFRYNTYCFDSASAKRSFTSSELSRLTLSALTSSLGSLS